MNPQDKAAQIKYWLLHYIILHKGNYSKINNSFQELLKTETIPTMTPEMMEQITEIENSVITTLADQNFPQAFKEMKNPPFALFSRTNNDFVKEEFSNTSNKRIINIWYFKDIDIIRSFSSDHYIFALHFNPTDINKIKSLADDDFKIILTPRDYHGEKYKEDMTIFQNSEISQHKNIDFISMFHQEDTIEIDEEFSDPDITLLGVGTQDFVNNSVAKQKPDSILKDSHNWHRCIKDIHDLKKNKTKPIQSKKPL